MRVKILKTPEQKSRLKGPLKLFNLYRRKSSHGINRYYVLELNLRRIIISLMTTALLSYIAISIGLFVWVDRRHHNQITYWDIALPHRWLGLQELSGQTKLKQAQEAFDNAQYQSALFKYRSGLALYPYDLDARFNLAKLFVAIKRPELAINVLKLGFQLGEPEEKYIQGFFQLCAQYSHFEIADEIAKLLLEKATIEPDKERVKDLQLIRMQALSAVEDYEKLLAMIRDIHSKNDAPDYHLQEVSCLLRLNRHEEALQLIETYQQQNRESVELELMKLQAQLKIQGPQIANENYQQLKTEYPEDASIRTHYIIYSIESGALQEAEAELEEFAWMFGHDAKAIIHICSQLVRFGKSEWIEKFMALPMARNTVIKQRLIAYKIQSLIEETQWQQAKETAEEWLSDTDEEREDRILGEWAIMLTEAMIENSEFNVKTLREKLTTQRMPMAGYLKTARAYESIGEWQNAITFLEIGLKHHPFQIDLKKALDEINLLLTTDQTDRDSKISGIMQQQSRFKHSTATKKEKTWEDYKERIAIRDNN